MSDVDAVVFDLDRTLCRYRRPGSAVLAAAFDEVGVDPFFAVTDFYAVMDEYVPESDTAAENRRLCFAALAGRAGRDPAVGRAVADAYVAERDHRNVEWLPGARAAVATLADRYPLALVTNGAPEMQREKLRALGLTDRFEATVYAGWGLPAKPDPEPFYEALGTLGVDPERAVTVGDSLSSDVAGAHNAGLRSVWVEREGVADPDPEPHYRIDSLDELCDVPWV